MKRARSIALATPVLVLAMAGGSQSSVAGKAPPNLPKTVDAADFVPEVTNPYFPLKPGTTFHWRGSVDGKRVREEFHVTRQKETILGIATTVVHDRSWVSGKLEEDTIDWFAQDRDGNVRYFGEASKQADSKGQLTNTAGSWQAGTGGAPVGIFMPKHPVLDQAYRQEQVPGEAGDQYTISSLAAWVRVPAVSTGKAIRTEERNPQEPKVLIEKHYVKGFGLVREATLRGDESELLELVRVTHD
jgi:hypothetical protein